jgi:DNA-binding GntR family transcriptional regulator
LRKRGVIETRRGSGTYVTRPYTPAASEELTNDDPWTTLTPNGDPRFERADAKGVVTDLLMIPEHDPIIIRRQAAVSTITGKPVLCTRIIPSIVMEQTPGQPEAFHERPDLMTMWQNHFGPLTTAHYLRAVIPAADRWPDLAITKPTAAQEHLVVTETTDRRPLMLELFLTAADVGFYIRLDGAE